MDRKSWSGTKKLFLIILRIVFVLFSLQFLKDAFNKWDGYSYYMRFIDFLPDLSLAYILWTIIGAIFTLFVWTSIYVIYKLIPKSLVAIRFEHVIAVFVFTALPLFIKRIFFANISLSNLIGLNRFVLLVIGGFLIAVIFWLVHKYVEKILYELDSRIAPVAWLFVFLFILALPISAFKKGSPETRHISDSDTNIVSQREKRTNIILVIMDTLSSLDMQMYGYSRPTTPFLSKWAKDATVFKKFYASSNWTTPAMMSIMTSQRPWTHKVWYRAENNRPGSSYYKNSLTALLRENGYDIYAFVQNQSAHPETLGLQDVFSIKDRAHTFHLSSGWWVDKLAGFFYGRPIVKEWIFKINPIAKRINRFQPDTNKMLVPPKNVYSKFIEYISQNKSHFQNRPFFAWLHVFPPHLPYLPPEPYIGTFGDAGKFNTVKKQEESGLIFVDIEPDRQGDLDIYRKRYDEFILYSDKNYELFMSRLYEAIDMTNTVIIFLSDHGEIFSHGWLTHDGPHLYEPLVHVPLIIKMPGQLEGKAIDVPVGQTDIAPTVLDLVGISIPEWMEGRSLLPLLQGESIEPRPVYSMQLIENRSFGQPINKGTIAVWDIDYKLIYYLEDEKKLLFNLKADPDEQFNLFEQEPVIGQRLMRLINDNLSLANGRITQSGKE